MRPRHVLGAAAAALLLAACQASASPLASPSPSEVAASGAPHPSFVGAPDLEATLPTEAAGIPLQSFPVSGPDFVAGEETEQFVAFIESLGADINDVSVALAFGGNSDGTQTATVLAYRVPGAQAQELIDAFKASAAGGLMWHADSIGGKSVETSEPNPPDFPIPVALYATGEVLYFVSSTDPNATQEILAFLP